MVVKLDSSQAGNLGEMALPIDNESDQPLEGVDGREESEPTSLAEWQDMTVSMDCMALLARSLRMKVRSYTKAGVAVAELRGPPLSMTPTEWLTCAGWREPGTH